MKFLKSFIAIIILVFIFDIVINALLPEKFKKRIGTTKNYSLKSEKFHHDIAPNINLPEFWGDNKYQVITNEFGMRIGDKYQLKLNKPNIGLIGDSFVYGSGINFNKHFINKLNISNENYNFLNLGYVSYSPSIYYKKLKFFIEDKKLKFSSIYLFVDTSDVQDEAIFYREDLAGNIVRKWNSDEENKFRHYKYIFKNYLKQNSFIFKFYENVYVKTIHEGPAKCLKNKNEIANYIDYLDYERFGYGHDNKLQSAIWVNEGQLKILNYLNLIKNLMDQNDIKLILVYYPSAIDILKGNNDTQNNSHYKFLKNWSNSNFVDFINTSKNFMKDKNPIKNYKNNFILCDVHWNDKGHEIVSDFILKSLD